MKKISTADIEEGMVAAKDVLDSSGRVLLGVGTKLTMQHKNILIRRDIATILITEDKSESGALAAEAAVLASGGDTDKETQEKIEKIKHMFTDVASDPVMAELMKLALEKAASGGMTIG